MKTMSKRTLVRIARVMYDLQEYCRGKKNKDCHVINSSGKCKVCDIEQHREFMSPLYYNLTKDDIKRLEADAD